MATIIATQDPAESPPRPKDLDAVGERLAMQHPNQHFLDDVENDKDDGEQG